MAAKKIVVVEKVGPVSTDLLQGEKAKELKKRYGVNPFRPLSEECHVIRRIPTDIFELDYHLEGGWPSSGICNIWGATDALKTTIILKSIAAAQRLCRNCWRDPVYGPPCECSSPQPLSIGYLDVEGNLDATWAARLGVDISRVIYSRPESAEEAMDCLELLVREGYDFSICDSVAFSSPKKEIEGDVSTELPGLSARLWSKTVRKLVTARNAMLNQHGYSGTVLLVNQIRNKVGVMFGSPVTQTGGLALTYSYMTEVKVGKCKHKVDADIGVATEAGITFQVTKSKASKVHGFDGEVRLHLVDGDHWKCGDSKDAASLMGMAQHYLLLKQDKKGWVCLDQSFAAKTQVEKRLIEDRGFATRLRNAVIDALGTINAG